MLTRKKVQRGNRNLKSLWRAFYKMMMLLLVVNMSYLGMFSTVNQAQAQTSQNQLCEVPADVVLIMDVSGSMAGDTGDGIEKLTAAKNAANTFLGLLQTNDQSALVSFSQHASLNKNLSNNHLSTQTQINSLTAGGTTNIGDAIDLANIELTSSRANPQAVKTAILLTDGRANRPHPTIEENEQYAQDKADEAASKGYRVFTIGLGSSVNTDMLTYIAQATGASYFFAPSSSDLQSIYNQISQIVCEYGSISGYKYIDANKDGDISNKESGGAGWTIILERAGHPSIKQDTDVNGKFIFSGLLPDKYTIKEGGKIGVDYVQTYPVSPDPFHIVGLNEGQNITDINFGNYISNNSPSSYWQTGNWGDCSTACGGGIQTRPVYCLSTSTKLKDPSTSDQSTSDQSIGKVSNTECDPKTKPSTSQVCNTQACAGSISGYKYIDADNDGDISNQESGGAGWTIILEQTGSVDISQETDVDGKFVFSGLLPGDYTIKEGGKVGTSYIQTYPASSSPFHALNLTEGQHITDINFGNYVHDYSWQASGWEECSVSCGGGVQTRSVFCLSTDPSEGTNGVVADENCDSSIKPDTSQACNTQSCGGGGGGGGYVAFNLSNPQLTMQCSTAGLVDVNLTWLSNYAANSRALYDTTSHSTLGSAPNYGYANSSALSSSAVTGHSVDINGLAPNTVYYFRPVSVYNSNEVLGAEKMMTQTLACPPGASEIIVLGEEGAPILAITHKSLFPFANPGTKNVEYEITVTNNGDLISFDTMLANVLPDGLTYSDDGSQTKTWPLGDLALGETKTIMVEVDVATDAELKNYISIASTNSANHDSVSADANLEVREITVLAETGFSWLQLLLLLSLITGAAGLYYHLKQRLALSKIDNNRNFN